MMNPKSKLLVGGCRLQVEAGGLHATLTTFSCSPKAGNEEGANSKHSKEIVFGFSKHSKEIVFGFKG